MNGIFSGPWDGRRLVAIFMIAWALVVRIFNRIFRRGADDRGARVFLENFADDGLNPMSADDEARILAFSRCIHCGLCEAVCPLPVDRWPAYSRATSMAEEAAADVPESCPEGCAACVDICPTGVPLAEIPAFVHRNS